MLELKTLNLGLRLIMMSYMTVTNCHMNMTWYHTSITWSCIIEKYRRLWNNNIILYLLCKFYTWFLSWFNTQFKFWIIILELNFYSKNCLIQNLLYFIFLTLLLFLTGSNTLLQLRRIARPIRCGSY